MSNVEQGMSNIEHTVYSVYLPVIRCSDIRLVPVVSATLKRGISLNRIHFDTGYSTFDIHSHHEANL